MSAVERDRVPPISELIEALKNGQNTPEVRRTTLWLIMHEQLPMGTIVELIDGLAGGWRRAGEVPDGELDTSNIVEVIPVSR